jgi:hypothetical protein
MQKKPVFFDPSGRRAGRVAGLAWAFILVTLALGIGFVVSIVTVPPPDTGLLAFLQNHVHRVPDAKLAAPGLLKPADQLAAQARAKERATRFAKLQQSHGPVAPRTLLAATNANPDKPLSIGFYVNWDDNSFPSLKRALPQLDAVMPTWLQLEGADMTLSTDIDTRALEYIRQTKPGTPILPLVQNSENGDWDGAGLARLLANPKARGDLIGQIAGFLASKDLQGVTVDFESVPASAQANLHRFLAELQAAFKPHGWIVTLCVPFDDSSWNYPAYAKVTDYMVRRALPAASPGKVGSRRRSTSAWRPWIRRGRSSPSVLTATIGPRARNPTT